MRIFFLFLLLMAASLVLAAAVTYPAWLVVRALSEQPVHRVMHRAAMVFALVGLVFLTRRLRLADRAAMGFGASRRDFVTQLLIAWAVGLGLMTAFSALLLATGVRVWRPEIDVDLAALVVRALLSGVVVALIEETFFRGVLFTGVQRSSGVAAALIAPSALYASLHFLGGKVRVPAEQVSWEHGFDVLAKLFERYVEPLQLVDSFAALFILGVLLALIRWRTGVIAGCIGLHAAGVSFIALLREVTTPDRNAELAWLVGSYDGVIGWGAFVLFAVLALVYWRMARFSAAS